AAPPPAAPASHPRGPYPVGNAYTGYRAEMSDPTSAPPGVDRWDCVPTAAHPYPVILLPGTFYTMAGTWQALGPMLADAGYCVYSFNYGTNRLTTLTGGRVAAVGPIPESAAQLASFVTRVRRRTGAARVDIVGWSQGGMMPRWYLKFDGGAAEVHDLVGLAPSNHGTTLRGLFALIDADQALGLPAPFTLAGCPACTEQRHGSTFLRKLNAGGDTVPGVTYTVIETDHDEVVTPYQSAFLQGPNVTNIVLQDQCPRDHAEHVAMPYDLNALQDVLNALGPDVAGFQPHCQPSYPYIGTP
ncbi:MAG TPA: alpha/beta fold hydrolase, partial [Acidimicrobiales bacterium]|nr:alpha/beta fold hydrolase [Acidimicrobiales bacterium]